MKFRRIREMYFYTVFTQMYMAHFTVLRGHISLTQGAVTTSCALF